MASSPAVIPSPPPKISSPDSDDEIEYEEIEEEIEVEEEIEIEEELSEEAAEFEEGDDDDEIGEDLTPVRDNNRETDTNQIMELKEPEEHIQSSSVTRGVSVSNPLTDISTIQERIDDVKTSESGGKEELNANGERTSRDNGPMAPLHENEEVNHAAKTPLSGDSCAPLVIDDAFREKPNAVLSFKVGTNHTAVEAVPNVTHISPRLHLPQTRLRDPFSSAEFDGENKKLRIACEFHAKGWCIKGNSCRFLHLKDGVDATLKKGEALERQASPSACMPPQESGVHSTNSDTEKVVLCKDDMMGNTRLHASRESFGQKLYLDNYSNTAPVVKGGPTEWNSTYQKGFSGSFTSHDNYRNTRVSAFGMTLEEMISKTNDIIHNGPRSADLPYSISRQRLSFGPSSWNNNAFGTQNLVERRLECRASVSTSLQRTISQLARSESERKSWSHILGDKEPAKYNAKLSSDDWEPSVPFRPSHEITRNLLMKDCLYDPIRDGLEQAGVGDGRLKFSHSDQGSSVKNVNVQSNSPEEEEKLLNSANVGDTVKDNILSSSCDNKVELDKPKHKTELNVDGSGNNNENDGDSKRDGHMQIESKVYKCFQSALIEFVKELLKPTWRGGLLSKDAHKLIVKKSVDKVLSTLQPQQIPNTGESIRLYLSSSEPKLAKLVEAYIEKHGKS